MNTEAIILYRYDDIRNSSETVNVRLSEFLITKETECGWWIGSYMSCLSSYRHIKPKWISKTARKRFAYPTKEEALVSFKARKRMQIEIVRGQLQRAKDALLIVENPYWLKQNNHDHP